MGDGFIDGGAGDAQLGEFCIVAVAAQHINRRERPRRALIGRGALHNDPINAPSGALRRGISHILEAAIDDRFKPIQLWLRLLAEIAAIQPGTPVFRAACATLMSPAVAVATASIASLAHARLVRLLSAAVGAARAFLAR